MSEIYIEPSDDLADVQKKIKEASGSEIVVNIPTDSTIKNPLTLRLLVREAATSGKRIRFSSSDQKIKKIISSLEQSSLPLQTKSQNQTRGQASFVVGRDVARDRTSSEPVSSSTARRKTRFPVFSSISEKISTKSFVSLFGSRSVLGLILGIVISMLLVAGLYFLLTKTHKVTIRIVVKPEGLVKSFEVAASPLLEKVDMASQKIPAQLFEYSEVGSETTKSSGTDVVGEKAKGIVSIYNKTDDDQEFPKGTKLTLGKTEGEDLIFYLDTAVVIDKRTASSTESEVGQSTVTYTYGKADVNVSAADIGDEYNIKKEETFTVNDLPISDFIAKNADPIRGGSRKDVVVVAQSDQDRLAASLTERLNGNVKQNIKSKFKDDAVVEDNAIEFVILSKSFDQNLGAVADEVTLTMEVKGVAYAYSRDDLSELLSGALGGSVPERFTLTEAEQDISVEGSRVQNGELQFFAKVRGQAIPKIDVDKVKEAVRGKRIEMVQAYLGSLGVIESYEIELSPKLPKAFQKFPNDLRKITVEVSYEVKE